MPDTVVPGTPETGSGIHILMDLKECIGPQSYMLDKDTIEAMLTRLVIEANLTPVSSCFHKFDGEQSGVSGAVVLQESHISIHTWPELSLVQADVFVCNYSSDNTVKANTLVHALCGIYKPQAAHIQEVVR